MHKSFTIASALSLFAAANAFAQSGTELLLRPMAESVRFDGTASTAYFFDTEAGDADEDFQLTRHLAEGRLRLVPGFEADPRLGFSFMQMNIHTDDALLPDHLTDVSFGLGTGIARYEGWIAGLVVGGGHAAANTFGDDNGYYATATLLLGRTIDEFSSIGVAIDYNGNRSFMPDVPLPGIVYTRKIPDRKLEVSLGFPFAFGRWRPIEPLLLEVNFTFPDFVGGRLSYDLAPGIGLFGSLASRTDSFTYDLLDDNNDRLFFHQSVAEGGVRYSLDDKFVVLLAGGYAFNQEFRYGWDTRDTEELSKIDDGFFARIEGQFSF